MDPTRHITYEETNSELAIFYSGNKKWTQVVTSWRKNFWTGLFFFFLENKINLDLSCHIMRKKILN
jgi:hypothetical protein